jgi:hypothetical protein
MRIVTLRNRVPVIAIVALLFLAGCVSGMRAPRCGDADRLRRTARQQYSDEAVGFRYKNVARFVPCTDPDAVYLITADHETHTCLQVREHAAERFANIVSGTFEVWITSVFVTGDQSSEAEITYDFAFSNLVRRADNTVHHVEVHGRHRDHWTCTNGSWELSRMTELEPQQVSVDGKARAN